MHCSTKISVNSKYKNSKYLIKSILLSFLVAVLVSAKPYKSCAQNPSQKNDSLEVKYHSPHKATIYAMVLPGLGQAYNKKYWKIPVVYAGFATLAYFIFNNRNEYVKYRDAYDYVTQGDTLFPINNEYVNKYDQEQLLSGRDYYRRNLEFTYILTGLWYIITVLDATVDAHLFDYDISNDLSLRFKPLKHNIPFTTPISPSLSLTLRF